MPSAIGRPTSLDSSIARPISRGHSVSSVSSRTTTPGFTSGVNSSISSANKSQNYPPLNDFTDDPFKDYRYEDPFNIVDPFSDDDRESTSTLPARTKPDGSPAHFDPFVEGGTNSTLGETTSSFPPDDLFSNDPFFSTSASQSSHSSSQKTPGPPASDAFGDSFADPFFSQNSSNGVSSAKNDDPFKALSSNGFGEPFSFSTNNQSSDNKFGDDNFSSVFSAFDAKSANGKLDLTKMSTSVKPSTRPNGVVQGTVPSEDEQLAWAAVESLKLENEQKLKEKQEREDLELALKLSQQGETSFPVKW